MGSEAQNISQSPLCLCMLVSYLLLAFQLSSVVQINAQQDAPGFCDFNVMSQKLRQAVLNAHNEKRSLLAKGEVRRNVLSHENMPSATNMLYMTYDCVLEKKAAYSRPCQKRPPPTTFIYTGMNFHYIKTKVENFRPVKTPEEAIKEAAKVWWDLHMNYTGFKGVTPHVDDYPIIPFLIMANAETPKVGCAVDLCRYDNDNNLYTTRKYYAVLCYYKKPHVMVDMPIYKAGTACEGCPPGYKCDDSTKLCKDEKLYFPRYPPNPPKP